MKMGIKEDKSTIEAALYAADRPLGSDEIRKILGTNSETYTQKLLDSLLEDYKTRGGSLELIETGKDTYSLRLREEFIPKLEGIVPKTRLSKGTLKTLAVIGYKQPIYQSDLAKIRSGRVYEHVKKLLDLGFIERKVSGRTRVLRTTKKFSGHFGFEDDMDKIRESLEQRMR